MKWRKYVYPFFFRDFDFTLAGKWLLLGSLVGVVGGLGAIVFQMTLQGVKEFFLTGLAGFDVGAPDGEPAEFGIALGRFIPWLVVILPMVGGLISGLLVYYFAPEAEGHGTDAAIKAYHRKLGQIRTRVPLIKLIASSITIGTGGSGGREGPIALIGAGFGSFLGEKLHLSVKDRRVLLAAGIGAGVGSIFRAPLAGAIFAGEVLYSSTDVETEVLLPSTVSSIVAYSIYAAKYGWGHMFGGAGDFGFSNPLELGPYMVLAVIMAFAALLYIRVFYGTKNIFHKTGLPLPVTSAMGGAITGLIGLAVITFFGQTRDVGDLLSSGYGIIQNIFHTDGAGVGFAILLVVGFGKMITTATSIGSGGSGGIFGPSMVIGATLGAAVGKGFHLIMPDVVPHPMTFAIVGMAGFFTAAANTPLSTLIMVSELTGNYQLLIPSMWVCTLAFLISQRWTIYGSQVPSKIWSPAHLGEFVPQVLSTATVGEVFHKNRKFVQLQADMTLAHILQITSNSRQRVFPVLGADGKLEGSFRIDELTHAMRENGDDLEAVTAGEMMRSSGEFAVRTTDSVETAQRVLRINSLEEVLVVDDVDSDRVVGILTSADILLAYTRRLPNTGLGESKVGQLNAGSHSGVVSRGVGG